MDEHDPLKRLEALASATNDLRPTDDLTDATLAGLDPLDAKFTSLARQTDELSPSAGFTDAVMGGLAPASREAGFSEGVVRWARLVLVGAAVAAAASVLISAQAERGFDSAILDGIAAVEVDE